MRVKEGEGEQRKLGIYKESLGSHEREELTISSSNIS